MTGGQRLQIRKRILLFSVFLFVSVFIWFLNALSKNYTTVINYPLEYTEMPEDRVFVGTLPRQLELTVNSDGYTIMRYKVFRKPVPINFKVSAFNLNRPGQDSSRAYIITRYLKDQVALQLPAELQLLEIKPDTLHFQFAGRVSKQVPVIPDFRYEVDNQFTILDGISVEPGSVMVTGPDLILDTLEKVYTEKKELGLISRDYSDRVRLRSYNGLEYDRSRVLCTIELERFTEIQLSIPVEVIHQPDSISLQTFPSRIKFTCIVGLSKYERINANLIRAVVDYENITEGERMVEVEIRNVPLYLISYEYYPKSVEFLKSRR